MEVTIARGWRGWFMTSVLAAFAVFGITAPDGDHCIRIPAYPAEIPLFAGSITRDAPAGRTFSSFLPRWHLTNYHQDETASRGGAVSGP
jgi:hypothetical protein